MMMVVLDFNDDRCSFIYKSKLYTMYVANDKATLKQYVHKANTWIAMPLQCEASFAIRKWFKDFYPEFS